jgi:hypothetical protein
MRGVVPDARLRPQAGGKGSPSKAPLLPANHTPPPRAKTAGLADALESQSPPTRNSSIRYIELNDMHGPTDRANGG